MLVKPQQAQILPQTTSPFPQVTMVTRALAIALTAMIAMAESIDGNKSAKLAATIAGETRAMGTQRMS
tara:strand:+ start:340 stop:543 length:204 start_codon:yes stop_codon:yes gene_type:complete